MRLTLQITLAAVAAVAVSAFTPFAAAEEMDKLFREQALKRVTEDIRYLASDELAGRKPGEEGIELAAQYIEQEYARIDLKTLDHGNYRQDFEVRQGLKILPELTSMKWISLEGDQESIDLKLNQQFVPQALRRGFQLDAELVFVGYGINAEKQLNYNDYRGVDVTDKVVVMIRREPQQGDPHSVFDGTEVSPYAYLNTKNREARQAGAVGIIMVNDGFTADDDEKDVLEDDTRFGGTMPFIQVKRTVLNELLTKSPLVHPNGTKLTNLSDIEKHIDETLSPISQPIRGWKVQSTTTTAQRTAKTSNIIGIIEGEGPLADETVIIGGHYDHLGMGGFGSRVNRIEIHNGADDNATGTAAVMELARRYANRDSKPARRMVFICFSAEEMGLLGASHYVAEPVIPLEKTIVMVNFDMIGWLRDNKVTVFNANSADEFDLILDVANAGFDLDVQKSAGFGGSDHLPFFQNGIPVMFLHTGLTSTYHTPEDDFETIDCEGVLKVIDYSERVIDQLLTMEQKPVFRGSARRTNNFVRLGISMDDDQEGGVTISRILQGSLAEKYEFKEGDVITAIGVESVNRRRDVNRIIRANSGKTIIFKLNRGSERLEKLVELKNE